MTVQRLQHTCPSYTPPCPLPCYLHTPLMVRHVRSAFRFADRDAIALVGKMGCKRCLGSNVCFATNDIACCRQTNNTPFLAGAKATVADYHAWEMLDVHEQLAISKGECMTQSLNC